MPPGPAHGGAGTAASLPKVSSSHPAPGAAQRPTSRRTEADELEPGRDHHVLLDSSVIAILLPSSYPTGFDLRRAKRAFERANSGRKVEVRASAFQTRGSAS